MKKLFALLLAALLVLGLCPALADDGNLLKNPGFEELDGDGLPVGWSTDAWIHEVGYTVYSASDERHDGTYSACVNNLGENDARFAQLVYVEPETMYCLSGWILADGILDSGWGANLSIDGVYSYTEGCFESDGQWRYVELYGETGEDQHKLIVYARVGGYSGESIGRACFDDLSLRKVDTLPDGVVADLWFKPSSASYVEKDPIDDLDEKEPQPFWPWLLVISAGYLLLSAAMVRMLSRERCELGGETEKKRMPLFLAVGLAAALVLRWFIASRVDGYQVDVNCFRAWGGTMASVGPTMFYQTTSFCDYPPGYVYIMGLNGLLNRLISSWFGGLTPSLLRETVIIKLVPMLCDLGISWSVYRIARQQGLHRDSAGALGLLMAFNPMLVINSAAWCQVDSVMAFVLLLVAWAALRRNWKALMPAFMLAVLLKPQALMLGFLGLTAIIVEWVRCRESRRSMLIGVVLAAVLAAAIVVPYSIHQPITWLFELYGSTLSSYAYATVNTCNLYYLAGYNWNAITNPTDVAVAVVLACIALGWGLYCVIVQRGRKPAWWAKGVLMLAFTVFFAVCAAMRPAWSVTGYGAMALAFAIVLPLYLRAGKLEALPLLGGVLFLLMYVLGIKMHERYLFPAIVFFAVAFAIHRDWRILLLLAVSACTVFINEGIVLDNSVRLGSSMGHLNNDTRWLNNAVSYVNLCLVPLALWTTGSLFLTERGPMAAEPSKTDPEKCREAARLDDFQPDARLHWKRVDTVLVLAITLCYAVVAFWHLGSTKAPQTTWISTTAKENVVLDLGRSYDEFSMLYYAQVSYDDFTVEVSEDGENWSEPYWAEMKQGQCFRWQYLVPSYMNGGARMYNSTNVYAGVQQLSGRYVRITAQRIGLKLNEVIFRETLSTTNEKGYRVLSAGGQIPVKLVGRYDASEESPNYSDAMNLLDEQDSLEGEPCWYTGTYFDEIYHARTAYEHLTGENAYETTHPPLGKVMMSWGVAIFGMTPFGWRFMGTLMGVLMLPGMYLLAKQLTKRTDMGAAAAILLALDCMHYAQTRIATIDSFPVVFIIWSYFFMARFMQRDLMKEPVKKLLPDLALCGFCMGCGIASKWIGIYSGVGLAVLFFWTCARHVNLSIQAMRALRSGAEYTDEAKSLLTFRADMVFKRLLVICLWCLLFFIAVPLAIYLLAYIPHIMPRRPTGFLDYLEKVWNAQLSMLSYHSTPGLGMDHPFYSPWYEWPFNIKPMYYAMAYFMPDGMSMSIFCFSNPAIAWVGLAGVAAVLCTWALRHHYDAADRVMSWHALSTTWDITPAFILIGLLAQYLPWVLVPRGTYIYHYFASIPFLILAIVASLNWLSRRFPTVGRAVLILLLAVCLVFFAAFFPYASGMTTPVAWLDFMKQFLHVYHS